MNERLQILKLLEQGKINAEEASRLLEALSHSESSPKKHHRMWAAFEHIPDNIATIINGSVRNMTSHENLSFDKKDMVEIKGISGDISIHGEDQDKITVKKQGFGRVKEKENHLEIKAISGDIDVQMPKKTKLLITGVSGSITMSGVEGKVLLKTVTGDVSGNNLKGSFTGDIISGDIDLDYLETDNIDIRSRSGDATLYLDDKIDARIDVETDEGNIDCAIPLANEKKDRCSLRGDLNKGTARIHIKCDLGDTIIRSRRAK